MVAFRRLQCCAVIVLIMVAFLMLQCELVEHLMQSNRAYSDKRPLVLWQGHCTLSVPEGNMKDHWGRTKIETPRNAEEEFKKLRLNQQRDWTPGSLPLVIAGTLCAVCIFMWAVLCHDRPKIDAHRWKECKEEV